MCATPSNTRTHEASCTATSSRATKPEDRYPSCRALAEDVGRWAADEPVTAWREPLARRARRWARHNRTVGATAAAAVLVALGGTATVLAVQTRANRDLRAANEQTRQERDRARQNFALARRAVDDYLTRVGQNPLLKETSIEVFQALSGEVPSSPLYQRRAGQAYGAQGKVLLKVGSHGKALTMLRKPVEILEMSDDTDDLYNLACTLALASTVSDPAGTLGAERQRRDADRAMATLQRAIKMGFTNVDGFKNDPDFDSLRSRPDFQALLADLTFPADPFSRGE
jgi:hypothetical protein